MEQRLVLTVIGDDRPGLVGELAAVIAGHGGNWLHASMAQLAGKFAGIVEVAVPEARSDALQTTLASMSGLKITAAAATPKVGAGRTATPAGGAATRRLKLALVGQDRPGIVREVTQTLARFAVNVENLATRTASAPMSAEVLFHCDAELTAAASLDASALIRELERISHDLMIDIALDEAIR